MAYGNLVMDSLDNCIQCTAGCEISNNVLMTCGLSGVQVDLCLCLFCTHLMCCWQVNNNQVRPGSNPRNVDVFHNTILNAAGGSAACFKASSPSSTNIRVGNNILFCPGNRSIDAGSNTLSFGPNALLGTSQPTTIPNGAVLTGGISTYLQNSGLRSGVVNRFFLLVLTWLQTILRSGRLLELLD